MAATPDIASIEFVHPESDLVVDRLLSVLEEKSPVQGFYHHLLEGLDSVSPGQTTPLGTVTHVLSWPSVSPVHARSHSAHQQTQRTLDTSTSVLGGPVISQRHVESIEPSSPVQHLSIPENARFTESYDKEGAKEENSSRRSESSEASSIEAIFNHEGKWEVLNEEELLADKETEHSKSGSSYSSSRGSQTEQPDTEADTTAAVIGNVTAPEPAAPVSTRGLSQSSMSLYDLRSSSPLIAEGYRQFPSVYTAFVLSVPPARLQTLLQLQEPVTFNEILSLSNQLYCNPHLLQGILTYLQVEMPFRKWCSKLVTSSVFGHPHSSTHTVGVIASTLSPELLPQVETGTPHHMPVPQPVSPRDLVTPVTSPPQSLSILPVPTHTYSETKAFNSTLNSTQGIAGSQLPPPSTIHQSGIMSQQMAPAVNYIPVQLPSRDVGIRLSRDGSTHGAMAKSGTGTPEMIPSPRNSPSPRHRIKLADSKLMSVHGVHKAPLSPSCRVIEIYPSHVVAHTAATAKEPQTTILHTGGVTVATTVEVSSPNVESAVALTQTHRHDVASSVDGSLNLPRINSKEAFMIDQAVGKASEPSPIPVVKSPLSYSPLQATAKLGGSPIAVTSETSYIDEWEKLSAGFIASTEAAMQVNMLTPDVLAETLRVLEPALREHVTEVETESQRRLELLYNNGQLPAESEPRTKLFLPQTSRSMSPRNIVRMVASEVAFIQTVRRFVKRILRSVELDAATGSTNGVVAMLSAQIARHKRDWPEQLENFIESHLSRSLSHSLMIPPHSGAATSGASTPGNSTLHYDVRSTAQQSLAEPMLSYVRPTYHHHTTHSFGGSNLETKDQSIVASDWRMDSRITSR